MDPCRAPVEGLLGEAVFEAGQLLEQRARELAASLFDGPFDERPHVALANLDDALSLFRQCDRLPSLVVARLRDRPLLGRHVVQQQLVILVERTLVALEDAILRDIECNAEHRGHRGLRMAGIE